MSVAATRACAHPRRHRGFTLIEMLVAVLVLSIGLLGLAGLQATGIRNNHSAYMRTQATFLAIDILDRMRANRDAAIGGDYDQALTDGLRSSTAKLADADVNAWLSELAQKLPSGDGSIARNGSIFTVTVQWNDKRNDQDLLSFSTNTEI